MLSIFDLPHEKKDLSSNNSGLAALVFDEVQSLRNVTDESFTNVNFPGSEILYEWDYSATKWWLPSRSYFRLQVELTRADGCMLTKEDDIAVNMGFCDSLFKSVRLSIAGKDIESISSHYPQIAALRNRLSKSGTWLNSTGAALNSWESSFNKRQDMVCSDGFDSKDTQSKYLRQPRIIDSNDLDVDDMKTQIIDINHSRDLTFAGAAGDLAKVRGLLEDGDIIVLEGIDEYDLRAFVICEKKALDVYQVGALGTYVDIVQVTGRRFYIMKYGARTLLNVDAANALAGITALGALTYTEPNARNMKFAKGDLIIYGALAADANSDFKFFMNIVTAKNTVLAGTVAAYGLPAAALLPAQLRKLTYEGSRWTDASNLGFNSAYHACTAVARVAGNKYILNFTSIVAGQIDVPLPNLRTIFRKGDIIVWKNAALCQCYGIVWQVNPKSATGVVNTKQSLWVLGSIPGIASGDNVTPVAADSFPIGRLRIPGPDDLDLDIQNDARRVSTMEYCWKPALSCMDLTHALPGGSKFQISLLPYSDSIFQINGIESKNSAKFHGANGDFNLKIKDLRLYNCVCEGPMVTDKQYLLDLQVTKCQAIPLTTASRVQYNTTVSPSVNAISIAFQDSSVSGSSLYSNTRFKIRDELERQLSEFYIRISQIQHPQPDYDLEIDDSRGVDLSTQIYGRNCFYGGGYYDSSQETLAEFRARGFYIHVPLPRSASDRSTRCNIATRFRSPLDKPNTDLFVLHGNINPNILLFDHSKKVVICQMDNGRISSVRVSYA